MLFKKIFVNNFLTDNKGWLKYFGGHSEILTTYIPKSKSSERSYLPIGVLSYNINVQNNLVKYFFIVK